MSLKAFHILFISLAVLLSFAFAVWAFRAAGSGQGAGMQAAGYAATAFGIALVVYGILFWRKMRRQGLMALGALTVLWLLDASSVTACTVCYGEAEGPMIEAARKGVWLMIGIVAAMQISFGSFFIYLWRRARRLKESSD